MIKNRIAFLRFAQRRVVACIQMSDLSYLWLTVASLAAIASYAHGYPATYCIRFDTDVKGAQNPIIINITQKWAPIGANHLFEVINSQFYAVPSAFFRVVPKFVVQFGISGDPPQNLIWDKPIIDGPCNASPKLSARAIPPLL